MKLPKGRSRWIAIGTLIAAVLVAVLWLARPDRTAEPRDTGPDKIIARGRLEPWGRVHLVSGPSEGGTIVELRVEEGSRVKTGDVLAVLDRYDAAQAALASAQSDADLSRLQQRQVSAGAKTSDITAQQALVASRQAELARAQSQLDRARGLDAKRFISADALEERVLASRRSEEALRQAQASLQAMTETRPIDQQVATAQVAQASARLASAMVTRERALIRAPIDGSVLAVYARSGGTLGGRGLLTLGNIDRVIAIAEFDEDVATRIRVGQPVAMTLRGSSEAYRGRIYRVLNDVNRNDRPTSDVLTGRDARVVEAEIHFDPGQTIPKLIGAEVTITASVARQNRK